MLVLEDIFALLELQLDGTVKRLPRILHFAALRLLYPAEAALRRLILVAAQSVKLRLPKPCPFPQGRIITTDKTGPLRFQLYDTRKNFKERIGAPHIKKLIPRLHSFVPSPLIPIVAARSTTSRNSNNLCRRFLAFKAALENIPHQAQRMALWHMRRAQKPSPAFRFPLRPGPAPGLLRKPTRDIDTLLKACHEFAFDYAPLNSS